MFRLFKRSDLIIIAAVLALSVASLVIFRFIRGFAEPAAVEIRVNGSLTATYPLNIDRSFTVEGFNGGMVYGVIKDGVVDVTDATCPDRICVDHSAISHTGESIVCLPNRVVVTISSHKTEADTIDAISGR